MSHFSLKKLLRLGSHAAMLSAGAGIGVEMSLAFQNYLQRQDIKGIDDIANIALFFFTEQYGKWLSQKGKQPALLSASGESSKEDLPLNEVYLIVGGYSFRDRAQPYRLHLFSSEGERISIKAIPTSRTIVVPRSLSMERRLEAQREGGASLDQLLNLCKSFLKRRSTEGEEVGPPFYFATITPSGYREIAEEEVEG
jgi:hypothetical protein